MTKITRRQFMALALGAIGAGAVALVGLDRLLNDDGSVTIDPEMGELDEATLATLMALVATYVGEHGSTAHYRPYFTWRAENLPEYRSTYEAFAVALDESAREMAGASFVEADGVSREAILRDALMLPDPASALTDPQIPVGDDLSDAERALWLRFDRMVVGEMVRVFLNTNGWILLGYEAWPGQGRGLEGYTEPVTDGSEA